MFAYCNNCPVLAMDLYGCAGEEITIGLTGLEVFLLWLEENLGAICSGVPLLFFVKTEPIVITATAISEPSMI